MMPRSSALQHTSALALATLTLLFTVACQDSKPAAVDDAVLASKVDETQAVARARPPITVTKTPG